MDLYGRLYSLHKFSLPWLLSLCLDHNKPPVQRPAVRSGFLQFPNSFVFGVATSAYQIEALTWRSRHSRDVLFASLQKMCASDRAQRRLVAEEPPSGILSLKLMAIQATVQRARLPVTTIIDFRTLITSFGDRLKYGEIFNLWMSMEVYACLHIHVLSWWKVCHFFKILLQQDVIDSTQDDVRVMAKLQVKAYRFSISWSRILPYGQGNVNQAGNAWLPCMSYSF